MYLLDLVQKTEPMHDIDLPLGFFRLLGAMSSWSGQGTEDTHRGSAQAQRCLPNEEASSLHDEWSWKLKTANQQA